MNKIIIFSPQDMTVKEESHKISLFKLLVERLQERKDQGPLNGNSPQKQCISHFYRFIYFLGTSYKTQQLGFFFKAE